MALVKRFPLLEIPILKANPHLIPQIADPFNDEFDAPDGVLNASWAVNTDSSLGYDINRTMPHHLYVKLDGQGTSLLDIKKTISEVGAFSYTAHVLFSSKLSSTNAYIRIASSDDAYRVLAGIQMVTTTGQQWYFNTVNNNVAGTAVTYQTTRWHDECYIQLQNDGSNNWKACFSYDGLGWTMFAPRSQAVTIDNLRFYLYNAATTYNTDIWMASDFIRRNWRKQ